MELPKQQHHEHDSIQRGEEVAGDNHFKRRYDYETGVFEGYPKSINEKGIYTVEDTPHVHDVSGLTIYDRDGVPDEAPGALRVFAAHGYKNAHGEWVIADGRRVEDAISLYNDLHQDRPIQVAAVCNPSDEVKHVQGVAHAIGSDVRVGGWIEDGELKMTMSLTDHDAGAWFIANKDNQSRRLKIT